MNKISIGNAGEYFVAGELERRGYTVAVPMSNTKDFDILAIKQDNYNQYAIQVKTTATANKSWPLSSKNESLIGDNIIYIFVSLNALNSPEYHIVESRTVADYISTSHKKWLNTPGKHGQKRKDTNLRKFDDKNNTYLNNWSILK